MKKGVIIGIVVVVIVLIIVGIFIAMYAKRECKTDSDCLAKDCFTVQCGDNKCGYFPIIDCCGNEICETGETYSSCARDCPSCDDDNECTKDNYDYHEYKCVNKFIIPCCGNEICDETVETNLDCLIDCPDCNDNDGITTDSFNYATQKCKNIIIPSLTDDFEEGTDNPSGWSPDFPDYMLWDIEQVQSGLKSLKITVNNIPLPGGWFFWKRDFIPIKANQKYYLREWIKTENADQGAHVDVHFFDASYIDIGNGGSAGLLNGTNDWTFRESTFITPPGTEYIQILNGFYGTNGIAWFDNLTLIEDTN